MLTRIRSSLSARLLLLFLCAGTVLVLVVGSIAGEGLSRHFRHSIRPFVVHYVELLELQLGMPPTLERARLITRELPVDIHVFGPGENWSTSGTLIDREEVDRELRQTHRNHAAPDNRRVSVDRFDRDLVFRTRSGPYTIYYQIHNRRVMSRLIPFGLLLLAGILGTLAVVYYATRWLFRPIDEIREGVGALGSGNLEHRIVKHRNDELGDLTDSINAMADQISDMLEAKRQLLLAISHELRSPLTRTRVNLELLENSRAQGEIEKDIAAMEELITELLESERLKVRHARLQLESASLDRLISETIEASQLQEPVELDLAPVRARVDPARIKLLVRNLVNNALRHSESDSAAPVISLQPTASGFDFTVADYGRGIAAEHLPHLTEPFYRADPSRQRKTGGYGLGLYLCRMIVEAHGGHLHISSEEGVGTTVRCEFPDDRDTTN